MSEMYYCPECQCSYSKAETYPEESVDGWSGSFRAHRLEPPARRMFNWRNYHAVLQEMPPIVVGQVGVICGDWYFASPAQEPKP